MRFLKSVQMMSIFDHLKTKQVLDFNLEEKKVFKYPPSLKSAATMTSVEPFTKKFQCARSLPKRKGQWEGADIHRILSLYWNLPNDSKL